MNEVNDVSSLVDESGQAASGAMGTAAALARGPSPVHRAEGADVVSRRHGSHRHPARLCVAAPPGPASASSLHCAVDVPPGRDHLCRLCRTSLATSIQPAERSRRSHVYDVNPEQLRHVHKPPAHKSPKEPARLEAPDAQLTFCLRFSPGRRQLGRPSRAGDVVGLRQQRRPRIVTVPARTSVSPREARRIDNEVTSASATAATSVDAVRG